MKKDFKEGLKKAAKIIVIILVSITMAGLFVCFFDFLSGYFFGQEKSPKGELLKVILTFVAGIVGILVWYTSHRRVKVMQKQTEKTTEQIQVMFKGNVDTRFNNAVGHLSSDNATVVLGGIHTLHQIAVEHDNYTQVVHNLFCSYLRENSAKLYEKIVFDKTPKRYPVIIQTLIDYLFRPYNGKVNIYKNFESDLSFSTFINCDFKNINITNVILKHCDFQKCNFRECTIEKCNFYEATFSNVDFKNAKLNSVRFVCATLSKISFYHATLSKVDFWAAKLCNVDFCDSKLNGKIDFKATVLKGYSFEEITSKDFSLEKTKPESITEK